MSLSKPIEDFIDLTQAAKLTGIARSTWANNRGGTHVVLRIRYGRSVRVRRTEVEQFIEDRVAEARRRAKRLIDNQHDALY
jgi:predicted DNA-binding transcriptional regulator AlpA